MLFTWTARDRLGPEPPTSVIVANLMKEMALEDKLVPPFEAVPPVWQLRIGDHRVFSDVDSVHKKVFVRAVRRKPPHLTTEQIL